MNKRTILPVIALSAALVAVALPDPPLPPTLNPLGAVTLAWNKSASDTNPAVPLNYVLEQGNISGAYLSSTNVGTNLSATISGLAPGTYYFAVVALNTNAGLVSPYSNETNFTAVAQPAGVTITNRVIVTQ